MQMSRTEATRAALANTSGQYGQASVTGSAAQISSNTSEVNHGVAVRALSSNTDVVWVGLDNSTAAGSGLELNPGEGVTIKIDQSAKVWAISGSGTQKISYVAT
tara:strand:- start:12 stop:323 length:312 start_codon:yes stop_codon:yes gene_type:complete